MDEAFRKGGSFYSSYPQLLGLFVWFDCHLASHSKGNTNGIPRQSRPARRGKSTTTCLSNNTDFRKRFGTNEEPGLDSITFLPSSRAIDYKEAISARGNDKARLRPMR
jgi:hypothetical protein